MPSVKSPPPTPKKRLGRPPGSNSEESRRLILEVAGRHLAERGYAGTYVKDIADALGITSGAVYHYFPSKTDLVIAVYRQGATEIMDQLYARVNEESSLVDNVARILEYPDSLDTEETRRRASLVFSMIADVPRHPELGAVVSEASKLRTFFQGLVDTAAARGELPNDLEPRTIVNLLMAMLRGITAEFVITSDEEHRETLRAFQRLIRGNLFSSEHEYPVKLRDRPGPGPRVLSGGDRVADDGTSATARRAVRTLRRQVARIRGGEARRGASGEIY